MRQTFKLPYFFLHSRSEKYKKQSINKNKFIIININKLLTNHINMK